MSWDYSTVHTYEHPGGAGYILWRVGTGGNVELLDLQVTATAQGSGVGTEMFQEMLRRLKYDPPYATVFGFTRTCNKAAQVFYQNLGFVLSPVHGVYADGTAVLFSASYDDLRRVHLG